MSTIYLNVNNKGRRHTWLSRQHDNTADYSILIEKEDLLHALQSKSTAAANVCFGRRSCGVYCYVDDYRITGRDTKWGIGKDIDEYKTSRLGLLKEIKRIDHEDSSHD